MSLLTFNVCWHNCKETLFKRVETAEEECIFKLHLCLMAAPCPNYNLIIIIFILEEIRRVSTFHSSASFLKDGSNGMFGENVTLFGFGIPAELKVDPECHLMHFLLL